MVPWKDHNTDKPIQILYFQTATKHQKGENVMAIIDHHGDVLSPLPVAPVHETDMILLPEGLKALKKVAKQVGLDLKGAYI